LALHALFGEEHRKPAVHEKVRPWKVVTNEREEGPTSCRKGCPTEKEQTTADSQSIWKPKDEEM
jgi:hypothetical protein